jgi:phosphohistidine phosphatase
MHVRLVHHAAMKTLILARHAKSSWKHPELSDHDRPLNKRGRRDAPRMGEYLAAQYAPPQYIISSSALRALCTAEVLTQAFGRKTGDIERQPSLYLADAATLLTLARELPDELDSVMLVGHNLGMTDCLNRLAAAGIDNLPTCGVARIGFDVARWSDLQAGQGRLLSLDVPKALPDSGE